MSTLALDLAPPELIAKYEPVIGLEVHVQLGTRTKIFCGCPTSFGAAPNTNVCPVCLGLPGALPVLSREAVELAMKGVHGAQLHRRVRCRGSRARTTSIRTCPRAIRFRCTTSRSRCAAGSILWSMAVSKRIGVTRVHMEDDAGKSQHEGFRDSDRYTYVDLNRSGTPLMEIVSEPDMRSSDEAFAYLTELKQTLQFVEVSTCDMEKGHLRCDANVSVRLKGAEKFGTRAEVKNLNSFRFLKQAVEYEIARQVAVLEGGGRIHQETRLFNTETGETVGMRSKEDAHDYRYFPEPDLVPLRISDKWREEVRASMPELPAAKRARFIEAYGLREYDAQVLTSTRAIAEYFEQVAAVSGDPKTAANWVMGDLAGLLKAAGKEIAESPVAARHLGELVGLIAKGELTGKLAQRRSAEDVRIGRSAVGNRGARRAEADQRYGRAGEDRRRGDRGESETSRTVQERQNDGDGISGGPGDEGIARPGESRGGERTAQSETFLKETRPC